MTAASAGSQAEAAAGAAVVAFICAGAPASGVGVVIVTGTPSANILANMTMISGAFIEPQTLPPQAPVAQVSVAQAPAAQAPVTQVPATGANSVTAQ